MSRCFPFPPPGYEKKPRSDNVDLLAKEKHKEKKHKKEKRGKEKREGKEKKDRDRNKDKHKEKKDGKEKHKVKKKDKDKSRSSEDKRTEQRSEILHENRFGECSQKAEEVKDYNFTEELVRRIKDEEKGTANRMVENFTSSVQRSTEKSNTATVVEKKRITGNEKLPNCIGTMQRRNNEMGYPEDNFPNPIQRRFEGIASGTAMQKGRSASHEAVPNSISPGPREKTATGRSAENSTHSIQRRSEGSCLATASERERGTSNKIISKPSGTEERAHDGQPAESSSGFSGSIQRKIDVTDLATAMEKERGKGNEVVSNHIFTEQRNDGLRKSVAKDADKKIEEEKKTKEKEVDVGKGEKRKDRDWDEKNKGKDKDRHKEKEKKEKIREKGEHQHKKKHKLKDSGKKDQIDSLNIKPLEPQKYNGKSASADENTKKRKDFEMNGILHENDVRPNKFSRATPSSHLPVENGRTLGLSHVVAPCSPIKPGVINNTKAEKVLEIKDQKINGTTEAKPSSADLRLPVAADTGGKKAEAPLKTPHPDAKYLNQIYSIPKMEEWPEFDDQEWLFNSDHLRPKPKTKVETTETPQVWAEALRIESEDVTALPYAIPF